MTSWYCDLKVHRRWTTCRLACVPLVNNWNYQSHVFIAVRLYIIQLHNVSKISARLIKSFSDNFACKREKTKKKNKSVIEDKRSIFRRLPSWKIRLPSSSRVLSICSTVSALVFNFPSSLRRASIVPDIRASGSRRSSESLPGTERHQSIYTQPGPKISPPIWPRHTGDSTTNQFFIKFVWSFWSRTKLKSIQRDLTGGY